MNTDQKKRDASRGKNEQAAVALVGRLWDCPKSAWAIAAYHLASLVNSGDGCDDHGATIQRLMAELRLHTRSKVRYSTARSCGTCSFPADGDSQGHYPGCPGLAKDSAGFTL